MPFAPDEFSWCIGPVVRRQESRAEYPVVGVHYDNRQSEDRNDDDDDGFPLQGGRREQRGERNERGGGIREFLGNLFDFG